MISSKVIKISRAWPHKSFDFSMVYIHGDFFVKNCEKHLDVLVFQDNNLILRYNVPLDWGITEITKFLICEYYGTVQETRPRTLEEQTPHK